MAITDEHIAYLRERYGVEPEVSTLFDRVKNPEILELILQDDEDPDEMIEVSVDAYLMHIRDKAGMDWEWTVEVYDADGNYIQEIEHYTLEEALDLAENHMDLAKGSP